MHVIVVGGGMAGLYSALKLSEKGMKVTLIEASKILGGKVMTVTKKGMTFECGAGRFNTNHKILMSLLRHFGFSKKFIPLPQGKKYVKDGVIQGRFDVDKLLEDMIVKAKKKKQSELEGTTLEMFMDQYYKASIVEDAKYAFGYTTEFEVTNTFNTLKSLEKDFMEKTQYYIIAGGLSQLVDAMVRELKNRGVEIYTGEQVQEYSHEGSGRKVITNKRNLKCDYVFWCVTKPALMQIKGVVNDNPLLMKSMQTLKAIPMNRVYAMFPKGADGKVWFQGMPRITTNNVLRYIIPVREDMGFIMISYTDGPYANMWKGAHNAGRKVLEDMIMENLKAVFPGKDIPRPLWLYQCYWGDNGVHVWAQNPYRYTNTRKTLDKYGYVVCGEVMSKYHHGWIEGALETAKKCVRLLS